MDLLSEALCTAWLYYQVMGMGEHMPTIRNGVGQTRGQVISLWEYLKSPFHFILLHSLPQ